MRSWQQSICVCLGNAVCKLDIGDGRLVDTFSHVDLKGPCQVTDASGNVLVASQHGKCVVVHSPGRQWRKLLTSAQHSDPGYDRPWGVCVTTTGHLIVAWSSISLKDSVVIAYDM
jgi:hypothetical protein